ncbi:hypothetical protein GCM10011571_01390 [Marinithermofilum abyssi]|uniref:Uncharacterized protein n=1 Tax=Marinithermofilum abyssi TaxID=1571185 RepID=A0A8J2VFI9_9BACL|nr:hypothetical protein GCM10011571_01390 [Marinithermofilum abyssi]
MTSGDLWGDGGTRKSDRTVRAVGAIPAGRADSPADVINNGSPPIGGLVG